MISTIKPKAMDEILKNGPSVVLNDGETFSGIEGATIVVPNPRNPGQFMAYHMRVTFEEDGYFLEFFRAFMGDNPN